MCLDLLNICINNIDVSYANGIFAKIRPAMFGLSFATEFPSGSNDFKLNSDQ